MLQPPTSSNLQGKQILADFQRYLEHAHKHDNSQQDLDRDREGHVSFQDLFISEVKEGRSQFTGTALAGDLTQKGKEVIGLYDFKKASFEDKNQNQKIDRDEAPTLLMEGSENTIHTYQNFAEEGYLLYTLEKGEQAERYQIHHADGLLTPLPQSDSN